MLDTVCILINGKPRAGKDTFCDFAKEKYDYLIHNISTVDIVKQCAKMLGWNGEKDEKSRKFLSDLKDMSTECFNHPKEYIVEYFNSNQGIIFVHSREPEELQWFKDNIPNCYTLLIDNPNVEDLTSNHADANVYNFDYDFTIVNDGSLEDLKSKCINFIKKEILYDSL